MEELKQQLIQFFIEMKDYQQFFKKKTYEQTFLNCYENHRQMLRQLELLEETCESPADLDQTADDLASAIPAYVHKQMEALPKKREKEALLMDGNMTMVTFVIPILLHTKSAVCERIADKMIEKWNNGPVAAHIQKASFETLQGGFKSRLCYITTAVCESLHKPDDCYELTLLRTYRDEYLLGHDSGEALVKRYYNIAPTIVNRINQQENAADIYSFIYQHYLHTCIDLIEQDRMQECQEIYTDMVQDLQKKYLYS